MDTRLLEVFLAVVQAGSFSGAARQLNYSQPAVSGHIQSLERELGVGLFLRSGHSPTLTAAGLALVDESRHLFGALGGLRDRVREAGGLGTNRTLRVAAFPSARAGLVPRAIARLRAADPSVRVSIIDVEPPSALDALAAGDCDLVLSFTYEPLEPSILYQTTVLVTDRQRLMVSARHPLAAQPAVALAALADQEWIAGCPQCLHAFSELCRAQGFLPTVVCSTDDVQAVSALVAAGVGIAIRPELLGELCDAETVLVPLYPRIERTVSAIVPVENSSDAVIEAFLEALRFSVAADL